MKYIGKICAFCGSEFTDSDDVVVCPECGSPHHRKCYEQAGKCANIELHTEKFNWNMVNVMPVSDTSDEKNELNEGIPETEDTAEVRRFKELSEGISESEYSAEICRLKELIFFTKSNIGYYLPIFSRMVCNEIKASVNLIGFIFPSAYFANRKMWFWAVLSSILSVILLVPVIISILATNGSYISADVVNMLKTNSGFINSLIEVANTADFIIRLFFCLFANRLYYKFALKKIQNIKSKTGGNISTAQLILNGGTNPLNIVLIMIIIFMLLLATVLITQFLLNTIF